MATRLYRHFCVYSLVTLCIGMIYFAYLQLGASIYANAVTASTLNLQNATTTTLKHDYDLASQMAQKLIQNPLTTAQHLTQVHQLDVWISYLTQAPTQQTGPVRNSAPLLQQSRELRPTWPYTYVMQARLATNTEQKKQMLALAQHFGPFNPNVMVYELQLGFEFWDQLQQPEKADLARKLIIMTDTYKLKVALNNQLPYTSAQEKICNLLHFNQIHLSNCKT